MATYYHGSDRASATQVAAAVLRTARRIVLATQSPPDADALGSILGLALALKESGRETVALGTGPVPAQLSFLSHHILVPELPGGQYDLLITLDVPNLLRLGQGYANHRDALAGVPMINIDHHPDNVMFGDINLVDPGASAAAELAYDLLCQAGIEIGAQPAGCFLTALLVETENFRLQNSTAHSLDVAAGLVRRGAPLHLINEHISKGLTLGVVHLWGNVLRSAQADAGEKLVWAHVRGHHLDEAGVVDSDIGGELVNFILNIRCAEVVALFREVSSNETRVSLRSMGRVDVGKVAALFGGGGHMRAAGCVVAGQLQVVEEQVLSEVRKRLAQT